MNAQLTGLRYWLYHWFFTSFIVGTLTILFCQLTIVGFIWIANKGIATEPQENIYPDYPSSFNKLSGGTSVKPVVVEEPSEDAASGVGFVQRSTETKVDKDSEEKENVDTVDSEELLPKGEEISEKRMSGSTRKRSEVVNTNL